MKKIMFNDALGLTAAVLSGRKTMTRRVVSFSENDAAIYSNLTDAEREAMLPVIIDRYSRYQVGERVAIAQAYKDVFLPGFFEHLPKSAINNKMFVKAEFMPNKIDITDIQIQRLQDISEDDCFKEGIQELALCSECGSPMYCFLDPIDGWWFYDPREAFEGLMYKLFHRDIWKENPWVFVYTFKLVK